MRASGAAIVALVASCSTVDRAAPPEWLDAPPSDERYIYGIGNYVGALYPEDNLIHALDKARGSLSKSLQARVVSDTSVRETESTSNVRSDTQVSSDYVLRNSEHVDTWIDSYASRGKRGTVWVLMRVLKRPATGQ